MTKIKHVSSASCRIPSVEECLHLMEQCGMRPNIRRHSILVARVAHGIAEALNKDANRLNVGLVLAGALLHDIAKTHSLQDGGNHAEMGRHMVLEMGYPEVAWIVGSHVDCGPEVTETVNEATVVNYSDKRVQHDRVVSLEERLKDLVARYGRTPEKIRHLQEMACCIERLERKIFSQMSLSPGELEGVIPLVSGGTPSRELDSDLGVSEEEAVQEADIRPEMVLIFDLGKVILDFDHRVISRNLARRSGRSEEGIHKAIFGVDREFSYDRGKVSSTAFHEDIVNSLAVDVSFEDFRRIWTRIFTPNDEVCELIRRLKRRHRLILLSNTNEMHFEYVFEEFPILNQFDDYVLSYKVGERKPHPEIYETALRKAACPAGACVYIDDMEPYVHAARRLGIQAIHFKDARQLKTELGTVGASV